MSVLIQNVLHNGERVSILDDGKAPRFVQRAPAGVEIIDGQGLEAVPAFWDLHVHFREPGNTDAEDLLSGARAAAAGGYGLVCCEPNTRPVMDSVEKIIAFKRRVAELKIPITVEPKAALTIGQEGRELVDIEALANEVRIFSTDGEPIVDRALLVEAFQRISAINPQIQLHAHCEETPRSHARVVDALGDGPSLAREPEIIQLHLEALEEAESGFLHIQHVSMQRSMELVEDFTNKQLTHFNGMKLVTMEVTPHHLLFTQDDIPMRDGSRHPNWKMNPPLRSREDREAVQHLRAFRSIATDHAPHTMAAKCKGWDEAPFGVIGLETAFSAVTQFDKDNAEALQYMRAMVLMCMSPLTQLVSPLSKRFEYGITLIDWEKVWTVDPDKFYSKSRNCPFAGMTFKGKPVYTIVGGQLVMAEGEVLF